MTITNPLNFWLPSGPMGAGMLQINGTLSGFGTTVSTPGTVTSSDPTILLAGPSANGKCVVLQPRDKSNGQTASVTWFDASNGGTVANQANFSLSRDMPDGTVNMIVYSGNGTLVG